MDKLVLLLISLAIAWPLAALEHYNASTPLAVQAAGLWESSSGTPPRPARAENAAISSLLVNSAEHLEQISQQIRNRVPVLPKEALNYDQLISSLAARHNVSPALVKGVIQAESNFNPHAQSSMGAVGLMQVLPQTARAMGVRGEAANPRDNLTAGIRYLEYLLKMFNDDEVLAIAAYNCGPDKVKRFGAAPPIGETTRFVNKVMGYYNYNLDS